MSRAENPAFTRALRDAGKRTSSRSVQDTQAPGDTRARAKYGDAADQAQRSADERSQQAAVRQNVDADRQAKQSVDRKTSEQDQDLDQAAEQAAIPPQQQVAPQPESVADVADEPGIEGLALQSVEEPTKFGTPEDATPITAQIGQAAYRLGKHGEGEAARAEAQGLILPDSVQAQMLGKGMRDVNVGSFEEAKSDPLARAVQTEEPVADLKDAMQPAEKPAPEAGKGLSHKEQIALQTAQARNEVLARLAATGGETAADLANGDALRQKLQFQGLLARDARTHALESAMPPAAPNGAVAGVGGIAPATNSVDLTQVYETPQDDAVEQRVLERVANEARWLIRSDRQEVSLRLQPEHLGSLHMKVAHKDGVFTVHLTVDNQHARHLLESNLQDLRNRLASEHPGGDFQFNVDVRRGNDQPSLYARGGRPAPGGIGRIGGIEAAPAPGMAPRMIAQSGLSIYV